MVLLLTSNIRGNHELLQLIWENETFDLHIDCGNNHFDDATLDANNIISVRGIEDHDSKFPPMRLLDIKNVKILLINGEKESVFFGTDIIEQKANEFGADIVIYGTLDDQAIFRKNEILYLNPGSFNDENNYLLLVFKESLTGSKPEIEVIKKKIQYEDY